MVEGLACFRVDISQIEKRGGKTPLFLFVLGVFSFKLWILIFGETIRGWLAVELFTSYVKRAVFLSEGCCRFRGGGWQQGKFLRGADALFLFCYAIVGHFLEETGTPLFKNSASERSFSAIFAFCENEV